MPFTLIPSLKTTSGSMSRWRRLVKKIDSLSPELESIDDDRLRKKSLGLKYDALSGMPLDDLLVDAYALVREAARRSIGMKHYEVQLLGGIAMHNRSIAVMQTGEGKTLTASLPLYLHALTREGSHLATANDYLAYRDAKIMEPVFNLLGMSVGIVQSDTLRPQRQKSYAADITYSTSKEVGFDFLRDRLLQRQQEIGGDGFVSAMINADKRDQTDEPVQRLSLIHISEPTRPY